MAKTKQKTDNSGIEIIESPDAILSKTEEFFSEKKNRNIVFGVGGVIALALVLFLSYNWYITTRNNEAQEEMFQAVYYFEQDEFTKALNGDNNSYGFLDIISKYSGTKAANLSNFYIGAIYMKLAEYDNAIRYLKNYSSGDVLIQARAFALIGDAYMEQDDFGNAITFFKKAANHNPNYEFTPIYLHKLAIAQEQDGQLKSAKASYEEIINKHKKSSLQAEAQKQKARLEALITN